MLERPIENCYWVVPGKILAGEYPRDLDNPSAKLPRLTSAGVTAFIDLTVAGEMRPYAHLLAAPASHQRFPIPDPSTPHSPEQTAEQTAAALDAIDHHIRNGAGIAHVHCRGGVGRTGTIIGCWHARHWHTGEAALARLAELWKTNPKSQQRPDSPATQSQKDYVRNWHEANPAAGHPIANSYWVVPGKVLAGEYPRNPDNPLSWLANLIDAGVTAFIDLTEDGRMKPYHHLLEGMASHRRFSIREASIPRSPGLTISALDTIDEHINNGAGVLYVHCRNGAGRTGVIIGCWLARHAPTGAAALHHLAELWQSNPKSTQHPISPHTGLQRTYVRNWREKTQ